MWLGTRHPDTSGSSLFSWEWIHRKLYNETRYGVHMATSGSEEVKMGKQEGVMHVLMRCESLWHTCEDSSAEPREVWDLSKVQ